jgi:hypothetical protein
MNSYSLIATLQEWLCKVYGDFARHKKMKENNVIQVTEGILGIFLRQGLTV